MKTEPMKTEALLIPVVESGRTRNRVARLIKYWFIFRIGLATQMAYVLEICVRAIFLVLVLYIIAQLWIVTYSTVGQPRIASFTVGQMVWYIMFAQIIVMTRPRMTLEIDADVRGGDIAYQLIRPYDYVGFRLAGYLAERFARMAIMAPIAVAVTILLVGSVPLDPLAVVAGLVLVAIGIILDFCGAMAVGLCAFWVEDTQPITLMYDRAIMLLGGLVLPLELMPDWLSPVLRVLPFHLLLYVPSKLVVGGDLAVFFDALPQLVLTTGAAIIGLRLLYGRAVQRLNANGG